MLFKNEDYYYLINGCKYACSTVDGYRPAWINIALLIAAVVINYTTRAR